MLPIHMVIIEGFFLVIGCHGGCYVLHLIMMHQDQYMQSTLLESLKMGPWKSEIYGEVGKT